MTPNDAKQHLTSMHPVFLAQLLRRRRRLPTCSMRNSDGLLAMQLNDPGSLGAGHLKVPSCGYHPRRRDSSGGMLPGSGSIWRAALAAIVSWGRWVHSQV